MPGGEITIPKMRGHGAPLPPAVRSGFEQRFGHDFSGVRVHTDTSANSAARALHAKAFTHGSDIYFSAGRFDPASRGGRQLLAHELTHVVQQKGTPGTLLQADFESDFAGMPAEVLVSDTPRRPRNTIRTNNSAGASIYAPYRSYNVLEIDQAHDGLEMTSRDPVFALLVHNPAMSQHEVNRHIAEGGEMPDRISIGQLKSYARSRGESMPVTVLIARHDNAFHLAAVEEYHLSRGNAGEGYVQGAPEVRGAGRILFLHCVLDVVRRGGYEIDVKVGLGPETAAFHQEILRIAQPADVTPADIEPGETRYFLGAREMARLLAAWGEDMLDDTQRQDLRSLGQENSSFSTERIRQIIAPPPAQSVTESAEIGAAQQAQVASRASTTSFDGTPLSTDADFVAAQLRERIARYGMENTAEFVREYVRHAHFAGFNRYDEAGVPPPVDAAADPSGASAVEPLMESQIADVLQEQFNLIERHNGEITGAFRQEAIRVTRDLLSQSRATIEGERARYGITSHQEPTGEVRVLGTDEVYETTMTVYEMSDDPSAVASRQGLIDAARQLVAARERINRLTTTQSIERGMSMAPPGNSRFRQGEREAADARMEYDILRARLEAQYPILAAFTGEQSTVDISTLGERRDGMAPVLEGEISTRLGNIDAVTAALNAGEPVWAQPRIVSIVKQRLGIQPGSPDDQVIDGMIEGIQDRDASIGRWLNIFGLVLGLLAAIPTGGASLAVAGAGAAVTAYAVLRDLRRYQLQAAEAGTAFDRARAISQDDPSMLDVALDVVVLIPAMGRAADVFNRLSRLRRAAAAARATLTARRATVTGLRVGSAAEQAETAAARESEQIRALLQQNNPELLAAEAEVGPSVIERVINRTGRNE